MRAGAKSAAKREKAFDSRGTPAYPLAEAAHFLKLPMATLRSWVVGRQYPKAQGVGHFRPLIQAARCEPPLLSFWNLIEAHVLRSLRSEHGVSLRDVRRALAYAQHELEVERLLLDRRLLTDGGQLFLDYYGRLINLSASGQIALRRLFEEHLKRVEWGEWQFPIRLYPFVTGSAESSARPIMIDPEVAFGRPVVARVGISTRAIAERLDAGESVGDLATDYGLELSEIEEAVLYERAA